MGYDWDKGIGMSGDSYNDGSRAKKVLRMTAAVPGI